MDNCPKMAPKIEHGTPLEPHFFETFSEGRLFDAFWPPLDSLLARFWLPFGAPWFPFGAHLAPFGSLLAPFDSLLAPFGFPLGPFWCPLDAPGLTLARLGAQFSHVWNLPVYILIFLHVSDGSLIQNHIFVESSTTFDCRIDFSYFFMFFRNPLPESILGGSSCQPKLKSAILDPLLTHSGSKNSHSKRNVRQKRPQKPITPSYPVVP